MGQPMYEVRVAGTVPDEDLRDLGALALVQDQVNTVLYGITDQAALYGLLARMRALGLDVVEVRRVAAPGPADVGQEVDLEPVPEVEQGAEDA
jgi:hypothetical protein